MLASLSCILHRWPAQLWQRAEKIDTDAESRPRHQARDILSFPPAHFTVIFKELLSYDGETHYHVSMGGFALCTLTTADHKSPSRTDHLYRPAVISHRTLYRWLYSLLYLAEDDKRWQALCFNAVGCRTTYFSTGLNFMPSGTRASVCVKPRWTLSFSEGTVERNHTQTLRWIGKLKRIKRRRTEAPVSPSPPERQPFERHDGVCGLERIWAGEVGVKRRAHPPPPPPAPRYTHDLPVLTASGTLTLTHTHTHLHAPSRIHT